MISTQHPNPVKIREAMDLLESADKKYNIIPDMLEVFVKKRSHKQKSSRAYDQNTNHPCSTICCHGGMFLLALAEQSSRMRFEDTIDSETKILMYKDPTDKDKEVTAGFTDGCKLLAKFLGFRYESDLIEWASDNPKLWGNDFGNVMFSSVTAFNFKPEPEDILGELTINDIINHWRDVANRIENLIEKLEA